jgi:hypothetical protein
MLSSLTLADLTELYRRAGYLITLTYGPSWDKKFGNEAEVLRESVASEFTKTAHKINSQATRLGTYPKYDDKWGD